MDKLIKQDDASKTIESFGEEWQRFDQSEVDESELSAIWNDYFRIFPWESLPDESKGIDIGCGSGRWAGLTAGFCKELTAVDASSKALDVAESTLKRLNNVKFVCADAHNLPFANGTFDFAYSLGVLHHIREPRRGIQEAVRVVRPGGVLLFYLYYRFDNRPIWYRLVWQVSDMLRRCVCRLPSKVKFCVSDFLASCVYYPLAKSAKLFELLGVNVDRVPLNYYRNCSFYTMRTDSLDRFGTVIENRYTKSEIMAMFEGLPVSPPKFSATAPFWVFTVVKK